MREQKMKVTTLALAITSAFSLPAFAQSSGSTAKPDDSSQCMEGMVMPGCPQPDKQHQQHKTQSKPPQNAQPQQPRQQHDMNNMPGMQNEQHDMSGMQMGMPQQSQSPDTHATMTLQEPENPEHKTGSNLPAPELLKDFAAPTPMALADFEALADRNRHVRPASIPIPRLGIRASRFAVVPMEVENRAALSNKLSFSAASSGCAATSTTSRRDQTRSVRKSRPTVSMATSSKPSMMR